MDIRNSLAGFSWKNRSRFKKGSCSFIKYLRSAAPTSLNQVTDPFCQSWAAASTNPNPKSCLALCREKPNSEMKTGEGGEDTGNNPFLHIVLGFKLPKWNFLFPSAGKNRNILSLHSFLRTHSPASFHGHKLSRLHRNPSFPWSRSKHNSLLLYVERKFSCANIVPTDPTRSVFIFTDKKDTVPMNIQVKMKFQVPKEARREEKIPSTGASLLPQAWRQHIPINASRIPGEHSIGQDWDFGLSPWPGAWSRGHSLWFQVLDWLQTLNLTF